MPMTPGELLSSITEDDINTANTPYANCNPDLKIRVANYIRILKLAPKFLNFIKDSSIYISTKKYSDDCISTAVTMQPVELTSDSITYKVLNDKDEIIDAIVDSEIIEKTKKMFHTDPRSWENISKSGIFSFEITNFFQFMVDSQQLERLRSIIQPNLVSEEEWTAALSLTKKYKIVSNYIHTNLEHHDTRISEDNTIHDVVVAAQTIEKIVSDGDVVVFVGNTPQLIRYPFEKITTHTKPNIKTVSLAISGHPDQIKEDQPTGIIPNVLTCESHDIYKEYMRHMGITKEYVKNHKVYLIDCVGSGGGLVYLARCINEIAYDGKLTDDAIKDVKIIALNEIDPQYAKFSDKIEQYNLKMNKLTQTLDRVSDNGSSLRLMPSASSYKWTSEFIKQVEEHSMHIFDHLNPFFTRVFNEIDMKMEMLLGQVSDMD